MKVGGKVRIQQGRYWEPAVVTRQHKSPRSYVVMTENGQVYRRNRRHLHDTQETRPVLINWSEIQLDEPENHPGGSTVLKPAVQQRVVQQPAVPPSMQPAKHGSVMNSPVKQPTVRNQSVDHTPPEINVRRGGHVRTNPKKLQDYVVNVK